MFSVHFVEKCGASPTATPHSQYPRRQSTSKLLNIPSPSLLTALQVLTQSYTALGSISSIMALNIPGLVATIIFYLLVLGIGIWASFKSKRDKNRTQANHADMALLGDRKISLVVGIFTTTGELVDVCNIFTGWFERTQSKHGIVLSIGFSQML